MLSIQRRKEFHLLPGSLCFESLCRRVCSNFSHWTTSQPAVSWLLVPTNSTRTKEEEKEKNKRTLLKSFNFRRSGKKIGKYWMTIKCVAHGWPAAAVDTHQMKLSSQRRGGGIGDTGLNGQTLIIVTQTQIQCSSFISLLALSEFPGSRIITSIHQAVSQSSLKTRASPGQTLDYI